MRQFLSTLFCAAIALCLYSCTDNSASPVRNVRFDPELLNRSQLTISGSPNSYTFTKNNVKQHLGTVYTKQVLAVFSSNLSAAEKQDLLHNLGFIKAIGKPSISGSEIVHSIELIDGLNPAQVEQAIAELQKRPEIAYAAPYFQTGNGRQLTGFSNEITVQLNSKEQLKELELLLNQANASVLKPLDENTYLVKLDKSAKGNALELANFLNEQNGIALAEPGLLSASL